MSDESQNPWDPGASTKPNEWGDGNENTSPQPWETLALKAVPNLQNPDLFWNELADFLLKQAPSILDPRPSNDIEIRTLVKEFCDKKFTDPIEPEIYAWLAESVTKLLKRCFMKKEIDRLSVLVRQLGLEYIVDEDAVLDYLKFGEDYDLAHSECSPEWLSGPALLSRWEATPEDFAESKNGLLPSYLWRRGRGKFERVTAQIRSFNNFVKSGMSVAEWLVENIERPCLWYSIPQWRHFRLEDIEFFEKVQPVLSKKYSATLTDKWLTFGELADRWHKDPVTIELAVRQKDLPAYFLNPVRGIKRATDDDLTMQSPGHVLKKLCLFKLVDVQGFERRDNKKFLGLNERSLDRFQIEELVRPWVRENPDLRTGEAVKMLRATHLFDHLGRYETLAEKIRPFIKNHTPGPRKKS